MSDEAEKATKEYADTLFHGGVRAPHSTNAVIGFKDGYKQGRASRDAEVAELREAFEEADSFAKVNAMNAADWFAMRTEVETLRHQLAAREAVIERARGAWFGPCAFDLKLHGPAVTDALAAASPSAVLAEHDARVWDECLTAIEENEINTQQAREGNPYRKGAGR